MYNKIFEFGIIPSIWNIGIIKPIPKSSMNNPRIPLQYIGISLISTLGKLYSTLINDRIVKFSDDHDVIVDEQNGFRKKRSCIDHLYSLTSIIRKRKQKGLHTFVAFFDMQKAFDSIDRSLLYYRLLSYGINGKIYRAIKSLYNESKCCMNLNGWLSDTFRCSYGVKQGDVLSPTLFNLYINDLAKTIKDSNIGIQLNDLNVSTLIYADDLVLISENESNLQKMIDIIKDWCSKWRLVVNVGKTKIIHFRTLRNNRTDFEFTYGNEKLEITNSYVYLGIMLNENLDYNATVTPLANSAGRALGALINKCKNGRCLYYSTYTKLYNSCVSPILDYASGVWGYKSLNKLDTIQFRAMRFFMGVHKFAPNMAVVGDMGWIPCQIRRKLNILKLWNRFIDMNDNRINKHIFLWDYERPNIGWCSDVKHILQELNLSDIFYNCTRCNIKEASELLINNYCNKWKLDYMHVPKLRTYCKFKDSFCAESYLTMNINRKCRSYCAQLRCGILPLRIETGRYGSNYIPEEERVCNICNSGDIENEYHFIFDCSAFNEIRQQLFIKMSVLFTNFQHCDRNNRMKLFMHKDGIKCFCDYLLKAFDLRKSLIYI